LPDSLEEVLRLKARATLETAEKILKDDAFVDSFGDYTTYVDLPEGTGDYAMDYRGL